MTPPEELDEDGKWTSAAQAFFLLAFFFAAVAFGADFRFPREIAAADAVLYVWQPPSPEITPTPAPAPPPKPLPQKAEPPPADIALKKKREEEKREKEERERLAEQKRLKEEREERERKEREKEEERTRLAEQREEELARKEREKSEREAAESRAAEARTARLRDSYIGRIKSSIRPFLITPPEARGVDGLEVVVEVRLEASGELIGLPEIAESSGVPEYDEAAYRAVLKASPLPMPKEPGLLEEFRHLRLLITPQ
ncbi:MAG: energy transducer TonB [Gammaproteobacteria bacterium]